MNIPFSDLYASNREIEDEAMQKIHELLRSSRFIGGEELEQFESDFAVSAGVRYCIGCASGTSSLLVSLMAMNIGPGDIVLTVPNTFIATAEAISLCGAEIDFIDVEDNYYCIDPDKLEHYLATGKGKRVKAVLPVHLYGQMADMDHIKTIADKYNIAIIEDASHAHGASICGKTPSSWGGCAAYSFFPGKILGAFGDAGAIVTNDEEIYRRTKMIINHGRGNNRNIHELSGTNARLDVLQAAILRLKLKKMKDWSRLKVNNARLYNEKLGSNNRIIIPKTRVGSVHVYHVYAIRISHRDQVLLELEKRNISTRIHYQIPVHLQPCYRHLNLHKGSFPVSEMLCNETLSLPFWPQMEKEKIEHVAGILNETCI